MCAYTYVMSRELIMKLYLSVTRIVLFHLEASKCRLRVF